MLHELPDDIAAQVDAIAQAYLAVETGLRELSNEVTGCEASKTPIDIDTLTGWNARALRIKEWHDQTHADVSALADEIERRGLPPSAADSLRGLFQAFDDGVGEASREFTAAIVGAASRQPD